MDNKRMKELKNMPESYWIASTEAKDYPSLDNDIDVDIAIVGGGMVGILTAYQLQKSDREIAILEGGKIVEGVTAYTTGKITSQHNLIYGKLIKQFGKELAQQYAQANQMAIREIKKIADENKIDCDYSIEPAFIYTQEKNYIKQIKEEVEGAKTLGIQATYIDEIPLSIPIKAGVRFDDQAQFHPRKLLLPLAEKIKSKGVKIYEQSRVVELNEIEDGKYILTTSNGHNITANKVIIASHYPFYNKIAMYYTRIYQTRAYGIVIKAEEKFPGGMYINAEQPNRSLRRLDTDQGEYILVVGDSHKTGQGESTNNHYNALIDFADNLFTIEDIPYRWSTQDCMTLDGVPYIGNFTDKTPNLYIATGFGKWGMTNSMVSSMLLNDLIVKGESPWEEIYNPSRKSIIPSAKEFSKQGINVSSNLIGGKIKRGTKDKKVERGQGKIIDIDGKKVGAYRDEDGKLHLVNLTCTHMGCELNWNSAERSWDCPCHGSRFNVDGEILNGPAVHPLSFDKDVNIIERLLKEDF